MFTSLSQFYTSEKWRALRMRLMMERVRADGLLYDEHSGEPLMHAYDIIAHHVKPVTMQNVNDYTISLNPSNIMLVSHRSHNEIHARYGFAMQKRVYYVYGAPCSGKTTWVKKSKGNSDLVIDIDKIWQALTGGALYDKPDALRTPVFAVRDTLLDLAKTRTGKWERCYIIEGGARAADRRRRIDALGAEPIFIDTPKEICLSRLAEDESRRAVEEQWREYIEQWFEQYQE